MKKVKRAKKATKPQLKIIFNEIRLLTREKLKTRAQIKAIIGRKYGKAETTVEKYISFVFKDMISRSKDNLDEVRASHIEWLQDKIEKAADDKIAVLWYDRLVKLYPNELRPETEDKQYNLKITYNKLSENND